MVCVYKPYMQTYAHIKGGRTKIGQGLRKHLLSSSGGLLQLGSGPQYPAAVRPHCLLKLRPAACRVELCLLPSQALDA